MIYLLFDLFLILLGAGIGIVIMCLLQVAKAADKEIESR